MSKRMFNHSLILGIGKFSIIAFIGLSLQGCENNRHMVLASTGTNIGVEISQNPATQSPQAKLGYQRVELAIVPTNRSSQDTATADNSLRDGAKDIPDVLMELRYGGIFDMGATSGIYQRLAVGREAVKQPGANLMFLKNAEGEVSEEADHALKALHGIESVNEETVKTLSCLSMLRNDDIQKSKIDAAIKKVTTDNKHANGMTWDEFVDSHPSSVKMQAIMKELSGQGIQC